LKKNPPTPIVAHIRRKNRELTAQVEKGREILGKITAPGFTLDELQDFLFDEYRITEIRIYERV